MKDRGYKVITVIALLVAITGLSIGYASYTTSLSINGSAAINPTSWKIEFKNLTTPATVVGHAESITDPTLTATEISGFKASLNAPGSSVSYKFDVTNSGGLDAKLTNLSMGTITCSLPGAGAATEEEKNKLCSKLTYTLKYSDGTELKPNTDLLNINDTKNLVLKVEWPDDVNETTSGAIDLTMTPTTLTYNQAGTN